MADRSDDTLAIRSVRSKLGDSKVRVETIIRECERLDKNGDGRVHADDLEDVLHDLMGPTALNRREINTLTQSVEIADRHGRSVDYKGLTDVLGGSGGRGGGSGLRDSTNTRGGAADYENRDRWDDARELEGARPGGSGRSVRRTGSIGEWLQTGECHSCLHSHAYTTVLPHTPHTYIHTCTYTRARPRPPVPNTSLSSSLALSP